MVALILPALGGAPGLRADEAVLQLEPAEEAVVERTVDPVVWERVIPEIEKIRTLNIRREDLPRRALFKEDQVSIDRKIDRLMDAAVELLGTSDSAELRAELAALEAANHEDRREITALREKRYAAPDEALLTDTVKDIDAKIARLEKRVNERQDTLLAARQRFADGLKELGLELQEDQLDFLLGTVIGDTVVDVSIAFYNIREITTALERLTSESLEQIEVARRYYGLYVVLLGVLDHLYEDAVARIEGGYVPEIETIRDRTRKLMNETRRLIDRAEPGHRETLEANRQAQAYTLEAATLYRDYLNDQGRQLKEARERLAKNIEVALNTYRTVQLSGDLLEVMQAGEGLFDLLFDLQVPELKAFENLELKREFDKLTVRLRQDG